MNTGVGCHALLQRSFPTQGSNQHLFVSYIGRWDLYYKHHLGSPRKTVKSCSSVHSLSPVQLFATPGTEACQASLSITNSWSLLKLISIELVMALIISSSVVHFSCHLQSFLASESFPISQFSHQVAVVLEFQLQYFQ